MSIGLLKLFDALVRKHPVYTGKISKLTFHRFLGYSTISKLTFKVTGMGLKHKQVIKLLKKCVTNPMKHHTGFIFVWGNATIPDEATKKLSSSVAEELDE